MGKASIISGGPSGLYGIELVKEISKARDRLDRITARLAELPGRIAQIEMELIIMAEEHTLALAAMNAALVDNDIAGATEAQGRARRWESAMLLSQRELSALKLEKESLVKAREQIEAAIATETRENVWCADLSESLSGEVGTIEIDGDHLRQTLIMPGGANGLGLVQPVFASSPAGTFVNLARMPGWQKYFPTYRAARITAIDYEGNTCSVALLETTSTQKGLPINLPAGHDDVPVEYMTCHAGAFALNDEVVVAYAGQDWDSPKVIGFLHDPKACQMSVLMQLSSPAGSAEFVAYATARQNAWYADGQHADTCKDVFIPEIIAHYNSLVGKYYAVTQGMPWRKFTQTDADRFNAPWIAWRDTKAGSNYDLGYWSYRDGVAASQMAWSRASQMAYYAPDYLYFRYIDFPGDVFDVPATLVQDKPVWKVDCDKTLPQQGITAPSGDTPFQKERNRSAAIESLWSSLGDNPAAKSVIYNSAFHVGSVIDFFFRARGVLDSNGLFYLISTGYSSTIDTSPPDNTVFTVSLGEEILFAYPSAHDFHALVVPLSGPFGTDENGITLSARCKGRIPTLPTEFGGYIEPATLNGNFIIDLGGPAADDPFSWCGQFLRAFTRVPTGFEFFAGRYPDHPIITGVNAQEPVAMEPEQEEMTIAQVQAYVAGKYDYIEDGTRSADIWEFLSDINTEGDCEDFALTKIQLLHDSGFAITRLQLQAGVKYVSYNPKVYDDAGNEILQGIGHVWVLIDGDIVLDQDGPVKHLSDMDEWQDRMTQTKLVWRVDATGEEFTAIPWPHEDFDMALLSMNARKV